VRGKVIFPNAGVLGNRPMHSCYALWAGPRTKMGPLDKIANSFLMRNL